MLEKLPDVVGHVLHDQRAGLDKLAIQKVGMRAGMGLIHIKSPVFVDHGPLPPIYTADGDGVSPPLQWTGVPQAAQTLVMLVEDADSPTPQPLVHAIAVDLDRGRGELREAALSERHGSDEHEFKTGRHSLLGSGWLPPDPPPGHGIHRYAFQLFALNQQPSFSATPGRDEVLDAIRAHGVASGWTIATYQRPDGSDRITTPDAVPLAQAGLT